MKKRNSSTIPFGYKLLEDNKTLVKVDKEVSALNEIKDGVKSGAFSLRGAVEILDCLLYTSPSPRDLSTSRMPSSA